MVFRVRVQLQSLSICFERKDKCAEDVRIRAQDFLDFVAAEACYHIICHKDFDTRKRLSAIDNSRPASCFRRLK